jgi:hypothetical protein
MCIVLGDYPLYDQCDMLGAMLRVLGHTERPSMFAATASTGLYNPSNWEILFALRRVAGPFAQASFIDNAVSFEELTCICRSALAVRSK